MATTFEERIARISSAPNATAAPLPGDISNTDAKSLRKHAKAAKKRRTGRRMPLMPVIMTMALLVGLLGLANPDLLSLPEAEIHLAALFGEN